MSHHLTRNDGHYLFIAAIIIWKGYIHSSLMHAAVNLGWLIYMDMKAITVCFPQLDDHIN
jgi:hypothetical protein